MCTHQSLISLDSLCSPQFEYERGKEYFGSRNGRKTHKANMIIWGALALPSGFIAALSSSRSGLSELCRSLEILKRTDRCLQFKTMAHAEN